MERAGWEEPEPFYERAGVYAALGDKGRAPRNLEQAQAERSTRVIWMGSDPELDPFALRGEVQEADRETELSGIAVRARANHVPRH